MSESEKSASQPVIIAGMHRSGTSLTASILQQAGVFIGEQLLKANVGNTQGHFEDEAFLDLHKDILISQGISFDGWSATEQIDVPQQFWARARALCDRRLQTHALWGWKEPRTTLFLNFWKQVLPQAKVILPYRSPWEVMDSLFTRGDPVFEHNPNFAAEVWLAYNRAVLAFYQQYPDDCFLFHCDLLKADEQGFVEKVRHKFGLSLTVPAEPLFQSGEMHTQVNNTHRPALLALHFPETMEVYEALQRSADVPGSQTWEPLMPTEAEQAYRDWVLQDWRASSRRSKELKQLTTELQTVKADLAATTAQLQAVQAELAGAETERNHWRLTVEAMESNRFWKMRNAWVSLKTKMQSGQGKSS